MCGGVVRVVHCGEPSAHSRADYEGYVVGLLMPNEAARDAAMTLRALNVETAAVRDLAKHAGR